MVGYGKKSAAFTFISIVLIFINLSVIIISFNNRPNTLIQNKIVPQSASSTISLIVQNKFGSYGNGTDRFNNPKGIAINASGSVYVVDSGNNYVKIFDSYGNFQRQFGSFGSSNGSFINATGIAINSTGAVFVVDSGNNRIEIFNQIGSYISKFGSAGAGAGEFVSPTWIAINSTGNIFVADSGNKRIEIFNQNFTYIGNYTIRNQAISFISPQGLTFDPLGRMYIIDSIANYLYQVGSDGTLIKYITIGNNSLGIAIDFRNWVYILNNEFKLEVYDSNLYNVAVNILPGQLNSTNPQGIAINSTGSVYFSDLNESAINTIIIGSTPSVPTQISTISGNNWIYLNWSAPSNNGGFPITGYAIYRSQTAGDEEIFVNVENQTFYNNSQLLTTTFYYYKIAAINIMGIGDQSSELSQETALPSLNIWLIVVSIAFIALMILLVFFGNKKFWNKMKLIVLLALIIIAYGICLYFLIPQQLYYGQTVMIIGLILFALDLLYMGFIYWKTPKLKFVKQYK